MKAEFLLGNRKQCRVDGIDLLGIKGLSLGIKRCIDKKGNEELLIVLTNSFAYEAVRSYKRRWSIESMFQDFKGQGFNLEGTHIPIAERVVKLTYLVAVAYAFCIHMGWEIERRMEHIPMKKHGYRSKSLFRKGMDSLREYFHKKEKPDLEFWEKLIDRFIRMARIKVTVYNNTKKS